MLRFSSPSPRAPPRLPFEFYPDNYTTPPEYPDPDEETDIRAKFQQPDFLHSSSHYVVCTARGTTPDASMHYSRCILSLWPPPVSQYVIKRHVLAHSCPEDLLSGIYALLMQLKLDRLVHPIDQCNAFVPEDDGSGYYQYVLNHALPKFTPAHSKTLTELKQVRRDDYDRAFDTPLNRGKLTLLNIHIERSRWSWAWGRDTKAALQRAAADSSSSSS